MEESVNPAIWIGIVFGAVMGIVLQRSRFCVRKALVETWQVGDNRALRAVVTALLFGLLSTGLMQSTGFLDVEGAIYLRSTVPLYGLALGGLLFGLGMVFAGGCPGRLTVRMAEGDFRAMAPWLVFVLTVMTTFDGILSPLRQGWLVATVDLPAPSLYELIGVSGPWVMFAVALGIAVYLARPLAGGWVWRDRIPLSGVLVGLGVGASWYLNAAVADEFEIPVPAALSFVAPSQELLRSVTMGQLGFTLSFTGASVLGVLIGACLSAVFRREPGGSPVMQPLTLRPLFGAVLMGVGGVLAQGCTFGRGLAGFSVLSLGSFLVIAMICLGVWLGWVFEQRRAGSANQP